MKKQLLPFACISCILMLNITACAQQHQVLHANFVKHVSAVLDVVPISVAKENNDIECFFSCLKSLVRCLSINMAAVPDEEAYADCQLLGTDKYNSSDRLKPSQKYHHFSIQTPCESFPCQNGATCRPVYEKQEYKCYCANGFFGTHCHEKITVGDRVFARWTNGLYYKGAIESETSDSFRIRFDDGDNITHSKSDSKAAVLDRTPPRRDVSVGTEVIAWWSNRVMYYPGHVDKIEDGRYFIKYNDGDKGWAELDQIRIYNM